MPLSEAELSTLVEGGCPTCQAKKLLVSAYVAQSLPLLEGELYGKASWAYKGEDLVRGTYAIVCADATCGTALYTSTRCPACDGDGGLERALASDNDFPMPTACGRCDAKRMTAKAYVPITVRYEGKRTEKARTEVDPEDPGFHAFRAECMSCREVIARVSPCPLCAAS